MAGSIGRGTVMNKYKISRLGRKLLISDDPRTLLALPKDVPERTWAEILQKEENELFCFEIREEILNAALSIGYEHYMEKQTSFFTVHCAALALLKIIDWNFYRHDPGEDPSACPPCFIPKRLESWTPDELPDPSIKDTWALEDLKVIEPCEEEVVLPSRGIARSIELPVVEPIPEEYWFPGRVNLTTVYIARDGLKKRHVMDEDPHHKRPNVELLGDNCLWNFVECASSTHSDSTASKIEVTESEVLQKVTDYPEEEASQTPDSRHSSLKQVTPVNGSLQGAGDSTVQAPDTKRRSRALKSKSGFMRPSMLRSRLPPLMAASLSRVSIISDCRLRNLRMDTQYEVSTEKVDSPVPGTLRKRM